ncbi:MAG: hypothetical protein WCA23_32540 [Stellaceae bacterium]
MTTSTRSSDDIRPAFNEFSGFGERLEKPGIEGIDVIILAAHLHDSGLGRGRRRFAAQRSDLGQDTTDAAFHDAQRSRPHLAAAGDLGAHVPHPGARRRGQRVVP